MSKTALAFKNNDGEVTRFINWSSEHICIVQREDTKRIEVIENLKELEQNNVEFTCLIDSKTSQLVSKLKTNSLKISPHIHLSVVSNSDEVTPVKTDIELSEEETRRFPLYVRYSAITHISCLMLLLATSWLIHRFTKSEVEPVVVQVFEQNREQITKPQQTVSVSKQKIKPQKYQAKLVTPTNRNKANNAKLPRRPGVQVANRGALGAFGGMGKQYSGSGGLNLSATKDNPGIGYGGPAARGGFERGMIGRGLVTAGVGSGGSLQGYGGNSKYGRGGGRPGYGVGGMAGSSAAYYVPLSEDTIVEGGLDQDQINSVVQSHLGQVVNCYEQGLQSKPNMRGRVAVYFVINPSGSVSTARVANSSVDSGRVENCIVSKLRGWKFPRPVGQVNVRVTYPFVLKRLSQG